MPYQGPWSECNHCNNSMLAARKHDASPWFGTPSGTTTQGPWSKKQRQGLLCLIATVEPQDALPGTPDQGPCALGTGPLVLAL